MKTRLYSGVGKLGRWLLFVIILGTGTCIDTAFGATPTLNELRPAHPHPFLMPPSERERIHTLIANEKWAQRAYDLIRADTSKFSPFWSAFLYALEGDPTHLPAARAWLLDYGKRGGDISHARERLADPEYFEGGQPHLAQVYYGIDHRPLVAYDYIYDALTVDERRIIEEGIQTSAHFRMRSMDRWTQTPNLVFKPTWMVALAGLVTQKDELLMWGFLRKPESRLGGYFSAMDVMLKDGGPWGESSPYPILHKDLLLMMRMSGLLALATGKDWFTRRMPKGGSPRGLLEYYLDTAYPIERTGYGKGQIRIATYGDAATSANGDVFLANPAGQGNTMHEELAAALATSGDQRYAAFLAMAPDYAPDLLDNPVVAGGLPFPAAPSRVWPDFGLAMLRSDENPSYWTSDNAIAVLKILSKGYGHDHRDKLGITLHGAGRLLYPDYNTVQYENPSVGWTRHTIAHNTLMVDEQDTENATPSAIRKDFTPEMKFLATSVSDVFDGVDQTRALLLTREYLLDVFHAASASPHTYDYLLHSLGRAEPVEPRQWDRGDHGLGPRFSHVKERRGITTNDAWSLDFVIDEAATRAKEHKDDEVLAAGKKRRPPPHHFTDEWYRHRAAVRVRMAESPATTVVHGLGPQDLPTLTARRVNIADTVFVATHEPFSGSQVPAVTSVSRLVRTKDAIAAKVTAKAFADYAAVSFGPQKERPVHVLAAEADPQILMAFRDHGYLRVHGDGRVVARGDWVGFRIPDAKGPLTLNGKPEKARVADGYLTFGDLSRPPGPAIETTSAPQLEAAAAHSVIRLFERDERRSILTVKNTLDRTIEGTLVFDPPEGMAVLPGRSEMGTLAPGNTATINISVASRGVSAGRHEIPFHIQITDDHSGKVLGKSLHRLIAAVGPVIEPVYQHPNPAVYRIHAQRYTAEAQMFAGLFTSLADDDGTLRLSGTPLFTISNDERPLLHEDTKQGTTWPRDDPASFQAAAENQIRWQAVFFGDRIMFRMDPGWTQTKRALFRIPGQWISPAGQPSWRTILNATGEPLSTTDTAKGMEISAAELQFPATNWNLCVQFSPPQKASVEGTGLRFSISSLNNENWTIGFCWPGSLNRWLW